MAPRSFARFALAAATGLATSGCGLFEDLNDAFADDGSVLSVFVTHHGTPEGGAFPPRDGPPRFMTDMGWEVLLADAYVTTTGATFFPCDGNSAPKADLEMYFGSLPEDLNSQDLDTVPVGGVELQSGNWCGIQVHYGPFTPGGEGDYQMENPDAIGTSVYIRGLATKDGAEVPFTVSVSEPISVLVSMSDVEQGGPLRVTDANNPAVTISKAYDRFFDGVDFNAYSDEELRDLALGALAEQTRISAGTTVEP